jgi:hypothetical protein
MQPFYLGGAVEKAEGADDHAGYPTDNPGECEKQEGLRALVKQDLARCDSFSISGPMVLLPT